MKKNLTLVLLLIFSVTLIFSMTYAKDNQFAWLGIATQTVDEELADAFDLKIKYGAIVNEIIENSPAEKAGIIKGDIIIGYNSDKVYDYNDLIDYLEDSSPDENITLTVMRDSDKMDINITLGKTSKRTNNRFDYKNNRRYMPTLPSLPSLPSLPDLPDLDALDNLKELNGYHYNYSYESSSYIGVHLTGLSEQLRTYFGIQDDNGVLVSEVEEGSPAEKAGIQAGDIIIKADKNDIADYRDLKNVIEDKKKGEVISITIIRDKNKKQFDVAVAEHDDENRLFFNAPDISIQVPNNKRHMAFFSDDLDEYFDSDEFKNEMKELKKELEQLKFEIKNEMFEQFNSEEFKQEMKELKKELKENESYMNKDLKIEIENLKKEFKQLEKRIDD